MQPDITSSASADMGRSSQTLWTTASTVSGVRTTEARKTIAIRSPYPRFVLAFDYKFNSQWVLGAEIEFEAGGTGSAYEIENTENGEYEMEVEKGGEVALEQFHITRLIHPAFNVRAGHLIVPVGLTNEHHEPINFFGTSRPEGETTILPSTLSTKTVSKCSVRSAEATHVSTTRLWSLPD